MHLMVLMEKAGVDLRSTGEKEEIISAPIDHHTLKRMGYKQQHGGWDYVGKGKVNTSFPEEGQDEQGEEEEHEEEEGQDEAAQEHTRAESSAPSRPKSSHIPSYLRSQPQTQNLATKTDLAHLQNFLVEQLHLMQATLLSKLESLDHRVQNCEPHLRFHHPPPPSPIPPPYSDPKGKAPMTSSSPAHHSPSPVYHSPTSSPHSPIASPHHTSQPIPIESKSSSSSTSSSSSSSIPSPSQYTIVPSTTAPQASIDSEATQSNPPSKTPSPTHPTITPATPSQPTSPSQPTPQPPPPPQPASPQVTTA